MIVSVGVPRRRKRSLQFAAFCFVLAMIVSCQLACGGMLIRSPTKAVHTSFLDVERMRAEAVPGPGKDTVECTTTPPRT
jgi:hypothetical protein